MRSATRTKEPVAFACGLRVVLDLPAAPLVERMAALSADQKPVRLKKGTMPQANLPNPARVYGDALRDIRHILDSTHERATPGEKLVRIGWVIGSLPAEYREMIVREAQNRTIAGWQDPSRKPEDFSK